MKIYDCFSIIRSNLWMVLLVVLAGCTTTVVYGHFKYQPDYEAQVMLMLRNKASDHGDQLTWDVVSTNSKLITTYKEILTSPPILNVVAANQTQWKLTADEIGKKVKVDAADQLQFISLKVTDKSYYKAASIANEIVDTFQKQIIPIMEIDNVRIVYKANAEEQVKPKGLPLFLETLISFVISWVTGISLVLILHLFYGRLQMENIERLFGAPVLAVTENIRKKDYR